MDIVVLAAFRGDKLLALLTKRHDVHPNRIADGSGQRLEGCADMSISEVRAEPMTDPKEMQSEFRARCT